MIPIVVISLIKRKDRRERMSARLNAMGLYEDKDFIFYDAIDGTGGNIKETRKACCVSHGHVLHYQMVMDYEHMLILEDDCTFKPGFNLKDLQLPTIQFGQFYLGGNHRNTLKKVGEYWICNDTYATHAYVTSKKFAMYAKNPIFQHRGPLDALYANWHRTFQMRGRYSGNGKDAPPASYALNPPVAFQEDGYSDIELKQVQYAHLLGGNGN